MAIRLYCDATDRPIPEGEPDAGAGPMVVKCDGFRVRVEVLPDEDGNRPNLLTSWVQQAVAEGELVPEGEEEEDADEEDGTVRLPVERRVEG